MAHNDDRGAITPADIKALRDALGWSQEELAHRMRETLQRRVGPSARGPSLGTVSRWERGAAPPSTIYSIILADLLREARQGRGE